MTQTFSDNYRFLARYNRWFNERLLAACETLSDEERRRDRGAFFGSIYGTLNHLGWADTMWLGRFAAQGHPFAALPADLLVLPAGARHETVLYEDWAGLRSQRARLDAAIEAWVAEMPDDFLTRTMRYSNTKGVQRAHPTWQAMTHFFNHQTHHRGQVTTLLMQAGVDVGVTDLIALV
ncbi:MAG: DinB family protein [Rhodoferax sp.]|nr:DinB family protein [Rhodoferax sp.]